jgi:hypothetical protein
MTPAFHSDAGLPVAGAPLADPIYEKIQALKRIGLTALLLEPNQARRSPAAETNLCIRQTATP